MVLRCMGASSNTKKIKGEGLDFIPAKIEEEGWRVGDNPLYCRTDDPWRFVTVSEAGRQHIWMGRQFSFYAIIAELI